MRYRRFTIDQDSNGYYNYSAVIDGYDGEECYGCYYANTIQELKDQIDCFYDERPEMMEKLNIEQVREYAQNLGTEHEEFVAAVLDMSYRLENAEADLNHAKAAGEVPS